MKYVCNICGYVYDDEKEKIPFSALPDTWTCPLCGAAKADFSPQKTEPEPVKKTDTRISGQREEVHEDMVKMSKAELATILKNLARGCEKQYKQEEAEQFRKLADYFYQQAPKAEHAEISGLAQKLDQDIQQGYPDTRDTAQKQNDRGAQRVCVWGEKVTRMMSSLLSRYEKEGEAFLAGKEIWVCTVCGFIYIGETAPELCPVCKVPSWKFEKVEGRPVA